MHARITSALCWLVSLAGDMHTRITSALCWLVSLAGDMHTRITSALCWLVSLAGDMHTRIMLLLITFISLFGSCITTLESWTSGKHSCQSFKAYGFSSFISPFRCVCGEPSIIILIIEI